MRLFVDVCHLLIGLLALPFLALSAARTGKYRTDWDQRTGHMPDLPRVPKRVWVHAVSVGEVNAVRGLIAAWRERSPDTEFVISTTTDTGKAQAQRVYPDLLVVRYPLDLSWWVRRAFRRIKPTLIVLVELEVWFHFTTIAQAEGIPIAVVNGRLSEHSVRWFARLGPIAWRMFGAITWAGVQDKIYAARFERMSVPHERIDVVGSLKWDNAANAPAIDAKDQLALTRALGINPEQPIWLCGSTGPGEEAVILDAYEQLREKHPGLQLVIVPRKPERFDEVAGMITAGGWTCVRRSQCPEDANRSPDPKAVILGDTMGELRRFYSISDVVFVGRTLAAMGGSDMMEPAALAKPIIVGPHTDNFADVMQRFTESPDEAIYEIHCGLGKPDVVMALADAVGALLDDKDRAARMSAAAKAVVDTNSGVIERTLNRLLDLQQATMVGSKT